VTPEEWIAALGEAAADARSRAGHADIHLQIGDHAVRIRVAPESMGSLLQPLTGVTGSGANGRTIELWDVSACGVRPPSLPESAREAGPMGAIPWLGSAETAGAWQEPGRMLVAWNGRAGTASGYIGDPVLLPSWQRAEPLRAPLNWVLRSPRRALAHAAALGSRERGTGLLIGGPGGSGKSTTALAWMLAGGDFAGDNYVLIDLDARGGPTAAPIYANAKADANAMSMLPELAPVAHAGDETLHGKSVLDVRDLRPDQPGGPIRITAIVISRVSGEDKPEVRRISGASALKGLAPSSLLQLPGETAGLAVLAALARDLPCFEIDLARDSDANLDALDRILSA
jgi:hypothetical protein